MSGYSTHMPLHTETRPSPVHSTPVVFSAFGGCGRETQHFMTTLVDKIATKRDLRLSVVMSWLRKRLSFALIRAEVLCIRGCLSWRYPVATTLVTDISKFH